MSGFDNIYLRYQEAYHSDQYKTKLKIKFKSRAEKNQLSPWLLLNICTFTFVTKLGFLRYVLTVSFFHPCDISLRNVMNRYYNIIILI